MFTCIKISFLIIFIHSLTSSLNKININYIWYKIFTYAYLFSLHEYLHNTYSKYSSQNAISSDAVVLTSVLYLQVGFICASQKHRRAKFHSFVVHNQFYYIYHTYFSYRITNNYVNTKFEFSKCVYISQS